MAQFTVVIRGYDRGQVDAAFAKAETFAAAGDTAAAKQVLTGVDFTVVLRGYDRGQVDAHIKHFLAA